MARGTSLIPDFNDVAEANDERFSLMLSSDYNAMVEHEVAMQSNRFTSLNKYAFVVSLIALLALHLRSMRCSLDAKSSTSAFER